MQRLDFDEGNIMKNNLVLFHGPFVENFRRNILGRNINTLAPRFVQHVGEQAHFKLKAKNIDFGNVLFATLQNDFFHKQARDRHVHRADNHHAPVTLAMESGKAFHGFRTIGVENKFKKSGFLGGKLLLLLLFA